MTRYFGFLSCLMLMAFLGTEFGRAAATPAPGTNQSVAPFLRLRDRTLDYPGPDQNDRPPTPIQEVRLGWFGPSDLTNQVGGPLWWAATLAVQEANDRGGCRGRPFRLLARWSENPWGSGVRFVTRLAYEDRVWAILGSVDGPATHLAEQVVAKARLPLVSPVSTDKSVNLAGVPWMFSCAPTDDQWAGLLARAVNNALSASQSPPRWALCVTTDHDSRLAAKEILRALGRLNRSPHFKFDVPPGTRDVHSQLLALENARPDLIVLSANPEDAARLVVAIRHRRLNVPIFGTPAMGRHVFLQWAAAAAEGVRFPVLFEPRTTADPMAQAFCRQFQAQFGHLPDYAAAFTYDAARILIEAIQASDLNRTHIREALVKLSPWSGITGPIQWDGTGQNIGSRIVLGTIKQGHLVTADQ